MGSDLRLGIGIIAINRKAGRSAMKRIRDQGKKRLSEGIWVMIFQEGTRVQKGNLGRFGNGGPHLACTANVLQKTR